MQTKKTVVIYGAGDFGRKLYALLKECGITPDFFCQTEDVREEYEIYGLPVLAAKQLFEMRGGG